MANALYDPGREGFADGSINWATGDIRVMLVKASYVFSAAHRFLADLGAVDNGRSASLTGKSNTSGICNAAASLINATAAVACSALVIFQHTGSDATARIIAFIDTGTGLPFTPAAAQPITLTWDTGANKIFKL